MTTAPTTERLLISVSRELADLARKHNIRWPVALHLGICADLAARGVRVPRNLMTPPQPGGYRVRPISSHVRQQLREHGWTAARLRKGDAAEVEAALRALPGVGIATAAQIVAEVRKGKQRR